MACNSNYSSVTSFSQGCPNEFGCIPGVCADFTIRRNDTKPAFRVKMEDCDGPMDLTDLILEATMWAKGKIKKNITEQDTYFSLADNIGFNQTMVGDIIIMDQTRIPEYMLVTAFDERNKLIQVQRGYHGTPIQNWKKGTSLRIMKFMGATAQTEMVYRDVLELDGTTTQDVLTDSFFIYEWQANDTCLPGCYYLEFKLLKMQEVEIESLDINIPSLIPTFISPSTIEGFGCGMGPGVEWVRRFPVQGEGFLIEITNSVTKEI